MPAAGPQRAGSWELSVGGGATYLDQQIVGLVRITDSTRRVVPGAAIRLGYNLGRMWSLSVGTFAGYTRPMTVIQPFGAISWTPDIDANVSPFLTLGGGVTIVSWRSFRASSQYGAHVGAGIRMTLSEKMALRLEAREQYEKFKDATVFPNSVFNGTGTVGLSWFLGGGRATVASVSVNPPVVTLESLGATEQLHASPMDSRGKPLSGRAVSWTSSNDSVTMVSATGLVTAGSNGSATIAAVSEGVTGAARVTVAQAAATVAVAPATAALTAVGQTQQLTVTAQDANGNPIANPQITWSSSAPAVTVNASGLATAVRNGTAAITATAGGQSATATVTVRQATVAVSVAPPNATIDAAGGRVQFTAQATDANGRPVTGRVITWADSAPSVATLSPTGLATAVGNGAVQILATVDGVTGSATLTVAVATPAAAGPAPAAVALPAVGATVVLRNIIFRPNSAVLPPEAHADLDAVAPAMQAIANARWEIGGYTSSMGNAARNQALSRRRALAVRTYLVRQGVPAARLVAVGYGAQDPIASNATAAGRRQNMRVEVKRLR